MLDDFKNIIILKSIDKDIREKQLDVAMKKLNLLVKRDFRPAVTYLKRGKLCKSLMMPDVAYSDFTYIITHCSEKKEAYLERMYLNMEIKNYIEAIMDANYLLAFDNNNYQVKSIKTIALIYTEQLDSAVIMLNDLFCANKYSILHFLFSEVAKNMSIDEYSNSLKILNFINLIDKDNPITLLNMANIYAIAGENAKQQVLLNQIKISFPKYFLSGFKYLDIYEEKNLQEINYLLELKNFDKEGVFSYDFKILEGYKCNLEGKILESKERFEDAIRTNPKKPQAYVLLAQTLQLLSGYDDEGYKYQAEMNYYKALDIFQADGQIEKVNEMKKQIAHLNSKIVL